MSLNQSYRIAPEDLLWNASHCDMYPLKLKGIQKVPHLFGQAGVGQYNTKHRSYGPIGLAWI